MSTNASLLKRYRSVMAPYLNPLYKTPISIDRGEGSYVWDIEGAKYLDFFGIQLPIGKVNPFFFEKEL